MLATLPMAKKAGRPKTGIKRITIFGIKGVPEYKTWVDDFANHVGLSVADTVGMSLAAFAEAKGFRPPPKR